MKTNMFDVKRLDMSDAGKTEWVEKWPNTRTSTGKFESLFSDELMDVDAQKNLKKIFTNIVAQLRLSKEHEDGSIKRNYQPFVNMIMLFSGELMDVDVEKIFQMIMTDIEARLRLSEEQEDGSCKRNFKPYVNAIMDKGEARLPDNDMNYLTLKNLLIQSNNFNDVLSSKTDCMKDMPDISFNKETLNFDEAKNAQTKWRYSSAAECSRSVLEAPGSIPGISTNYYSNEIVDNSANLPKRIINESVDKSVTEPEGKTNENVDKSTNSQERANNKNVHESANSRERKNHESVDKSAILQERKNKANVDESRISQERSNKSVDITANLQERTTNTNVDKSTHLHGRTTNNSLDKSTTSQERTTHEGVYKSENSQEKTSNETVDKSSILQERTTDEARSPFAFLSPLPIRHWHKTENSQERIRQHFNTVSHSVSVIFVMWLMTSPVSCVQMDWGENPNLVKESKSIQGREHIKLLVALVGEHIDLECQVLFTSQPIGKITWKDNGAHIIHHEDPIVDINEDGVFVEDHLQIHNVTEDMDDKTLTCGYAKGEYADRIEAILTVFKLEIEGDICENCNGELKLIFKESKRSSQDESNINERIRAKIADLTNVKSGDITYENEEYSLILSLEIVKNNHKILAMKPILFANVGQTEQGGTALIIGIIILVVAAMILVFGYLYSVFLLPRRNIGSDDLGGPGFRACWEAGCELCVHINNVLNRASGGKKVLAKVAIHRSGTNIIKKCCSGGTIKIEDQIKCTDTNIVYILSCIKNNCMKQHIGETELSGVEMLSKLKNDCHHFQLPGHNNDDMEFVVVAAHCGSIKREKTINTLTKQYKIRNDLNEPEAMAMLPLLV